MKKAKPLTQKEWDEYVNLASKLTKDKKLKNIEKLDVWSRAEQVVLIIGFSEMLKDKAFTRETSKEFDIHYRDFYDATGTLQKNGYLDFRLDEDDRRKKEYFLTPKGFDIALFILQHSEGKCDIEYWFFDRVSRSIPKKKFKKYVKKNKDGTFTLHRKEFADFIKRRMKKRYDHMDFLEASVDGHINIPHLEKKRGKKIN